MHTSRQNIHTEAIYNSMFMFSQGRETKVSEVRFIPILLMEGTDNQNQPHMLNMQVKPKYVFAVEKKNR